MELLTTDDLVKLLNLKNSRTIENWLQSGVLPRSTVVKLGRLRRFSKTKIDEWLNSCLIAG